MRHASCWASDLLQAARTDPTRMTELVGQIQSEACKEGYRQALSFATDTAATCLASLDDLLAEPAIPDYPLR